MSTKYKLLDVDGLYFGSFASFVTVCMSLIIRCSAHKLQILMSHGILARGWETI